MTFDIEAEEVRLLTEIGFMALGRGRTQEAELIFEALAAFRPGQEAFFVGRALVKLARGDAAGAIAVLRPAPPTDAVLTHLGMAYARWGAVEDARTSLLAVVDSPLPSEHAPLARALLESLPPG